MVFFVFFALLRKLRDVFGKAVRYRPRSRKLTKNPEEYEEDLLCSLAREVLHLLRVRGR